MLAAVVFGGHPGEAAIPGLVVGGISVFLSEKFWREGQLRKHTYDWYAKTFPRYARGETSCRHCGHSDIKVKRFLLPRIQAHVCGACDETLYYSPS